MKYLKTFIYILIILVYYFFSISLLKFYTSGDQYYYHDFYESLVGVSVSEIPILMISKLSSAEPLTGFIFWIGANLNFSKDVFVSILNACLLIGIIKILTKYNAPISIRLLILTNFYLFVLFTSAERLKIAYIFLIWADLFNGKKILLLIIFAILSHFQSIILIVSFLSGNAESSIRKFIKRPVFMKKKSKAFFYSFILMIFITSFVYKPVLIKAQIYLERESNIIDLINFIILFIVSILATKNRLKIILTSVPIIISIYLLGGMRVNMIAVTIFLYYLIKEKKTNNIFVHSLLIYFTIKSIPFISNIYQLGDGFAGKLI